MRLGEVVPRSNDHGRVRAHLPSPLQTLDPAPHGDHVGSPSPSEGDEHETDRSHPDDRDRLAGGDAALLDSPYDARQGLGDGGLPEAEALGQAKQVAAGDPRRDADELGVGAVPEHEVVAERLAPLEAVLAVAARSRVRGDDGRARLDPVGPRPHLRDDPRDLVAEERRRARSSARGIRGGTPCRRCRR